MNKRGERERSIDAEGREQQLRRRLQHAGCRVFWFGFSVFGAQIGTGTWPKNRKERETAIACVRACEREGGKEGGREGWRDGG
eukprot:2932702-Rhodomonas_salina.1